MLLLMHMVIAVSSAIYATYLFVVPSQAKFYIAYGLIGLTLISGTALAITTHAPLLSACESGLAYIGIMLFGLVAARYRAVHQRVKIDKN